MSEEVKVNEENQFTFENPEYRKTYWHTCSHVLAQAVKRLWPEVKLAIGPSIDNGFYYDMLAPFSFTPENLAEIEAEMRKEGINAIILNTERGFPSEKFYLKNGFKPLDGLITFIK